MVKNKPSLFPATPSPEMDPTLWSKLPEELLEHVLSCLPLNCFLNLRSTCKHFKSLLFSPTFISKHISSSSSSSSSSSFLLLSHPQFNQNYPLYDTIQSSWRSSFLSLSSLLPPSATLLSASNGMLCFSILTTNSFVISNLLARSSRVVKFPAYPFVFERFDLVLTSNGYRLFLLSSNSGGFVFVYDSVAKLWMKYHCPEPIFSVNYRQKGVYFIGCLNFTTREPFSIVRFGIATGKWDRVASWLPDELVFMRLVSDGNEKMYLFGGTGSNGISRSLKLWELEGESCVEIGNVPDMMCRKLVSVCFHNYEYLNVFWHQGLVCVCCYSWPEILYYKVARKTWHWLPKSPAIPEKWSCGFKWFSFVPELHAFI